MSIVGTAGGQENAGAGRGDGELRVAVTTSAERAALPAITAGVGVFNAEEVACVDELLDEYCARGATASGYHFLTCWDGARPVGFACYGPRSLTDGTHDLYWIVTDAAAARPGVGRALIWAVTERLRQEGGRLLIAETSGKQEYASAHRFYERTGFVLEAVIRDFYRPADDLRIYVLRVE